MNKKGIFDILEIGIYMFFVIAVSIFIFLVAFKYLNEKIDTSNLEINLLTKRLIYSDSCLAYRDEVRTYQGVVDLSKLSFNRLNSCFSKETTGYSINIMDINGTAIKSANNLNLKQAAYLPVCKTVPGYECLKKKNLVSYYDGIGIKTGFIVIEVINFVG